jgi:serine/threonine protein kinase, bacterial
VKRPERNLVLLLSDMKGFTARTSCQTREENARMLGLHDALLLPVLRGYRGRKVKGLGDALVGAFLSPTDAVLCAMAMQDRLAAWNAKAQPGDRIEVRIALSQGEIGRTRGDLHGEAMQLALEAEARAEAGEVLLTDAVYLSMNKSEAATEVVGEVPLHGGGRIRLRRALRGTDALAPYGGRALKRLGRLPDPGRAVRLRMAVESALEFARKRIVWAAAAVLLLAAAAGEHVAGAVENDPLAKAAALIEAREPLAALAELDRLADSPRAQEASVQVVRGKAEHALGQLGPAFADFAAAAREDPRALDPGAIAALADLLESEAFPQVWRPALLKLLGEQLGRAAAPAVRQVLRSDRARSRGDALHVLELAGAASDQDRLTAARADLLDGRTSCAVRKSAVRRLALVGGGEAEALLSHVASEPRACGAAEARDALRRRQAAKVAER